MKSEVEILEQGSSEPAGQVRCSLYTPEGGSFKVLYLLSPSTFTGKASIPYTAALLLLTSFMALKRAYLLIG